MKLTMVRVAAESYSYDRKLRKDVRVSRRGTLTRERVIAAAAAVADRSGLAGVSMRSVGGELGVGGMSLYHHVSSKDALLDALADWAIAKIGLPPPDAPWRKAMETRARSARAAFVAHPWAIAMIESRPAPSAALLTHHDIRGRPVRRTSCRNTCPVHRIDAHLPDEVATRLAARL